MDILDIYPCIHGYKTDTKWIFWIFSGYYLWIISGYFCKLFISKLYPDIHKISRYYPWIISGYLDNIWIQSGYLDNIRG